MTEPTTPDEAAPSAPTYVVVWGALVVLATVTLLVSRAPIGDWGIVAALAIASLKAALVLAFFMHLAHGPGLHRLVIGVAIGFVVLIIAGVLADVGTRSVASAYVDDQGEATPGGGPPSPMPVSAPASAPAAP